MYHRTDVCMLRNVAFLSSCAHFLGSNVSWWQVEDVASFWTWMQSLPQLLDDHPGM